MEIVNTKNTPLQSTELVGSGSTAKSDIDPSRAESLNDRKTANWAALKWGTMGTLLLFAFNTVFALVLSALLVKLLKAEGFGTYSLALALTNLIAIPLQFGLPRLLVREIAKYQATRDWGLLKGLLFVANQVTLIFAGITLAIGIPFYLWGDLADSSVELQTTPWALLLLPFLLLSSLRQATLRGLKRVVIGQLPEKIVQPIALLICLFFMSIMLTPSPSLAMALTCFSTLVAFGVGHFLLQASIPREVKNAKREYQLKTWFGSLLPMSLTSLVAMIGSRSDLLILDAFSANKEVDVAFFRVAAGVSALVSIGLVATNSSLAPQVASLYRLNRIQELRALLLKSFWISAGSAIPIACAFAVVGKPLLVFVYDSEFANAYVPLLILCIGQLVSAIAGPVTLVLNMTGNERLVLLVVSATAILGICGNVVLSQRYGAMGTAISSSAAMSLSNIFLFVQSRVVLRKAAAA
jgi:O-antigen/teichoic acid export membrane protein